MTSDRRPEIRDQQVARAAVAGVVDPEIPVLTIEDMGIVRRVDVIGAAVEVDITPTYSGCPAMDRIRDDIVDALNGAGFDTVRVRIVYSPAWTTDWMSENGRRKLTAYGIAPPGPVEPAPQEVVCPRCSSDETRQVSEFGSTACKALMVCTSCGEPFDRFKEL